MYTYRELNDISDALLKRCSRVRVDCARHSCAMRNGGDAATFNERWNECDAYDALLGVVEIMLEEAA